MLHHGPDRQSAAPERSDATFLHNPWHRGPEARWMPYAPLRRRRRPLREYWKAPPFELFEPSSPIGRQGSCMVFAAEGAVPPQWNGTSYLPRAEARSPSGRRQPVPDRAPGSPGPKGPAAGSTLTPVRACQPSGILESTVPIPIPTYSFSGLPISFHKKTPFPRERSFFSGPYLMSYMPLTPSLRLM